MLWLWIVIIAQLFNAGALLLDKFLLTKRFPHPGFLTFWTATWNLLGVVFIFWNFNFAASHRTLILALLSGIVFTIALQFFYMGVKKGEASHIAPLTGGIVPLATCLFSYFWLAERLNYWQLLAVGLLVAGTLIISFEKSLKYHGWHIGMLWAIIAGGFFGLSYVLSRIVFMTDTFSTGFVWGRVGCFVAALPLLLIPVVRQGIFAKGEKKKKRLESSLLILAGNKTLGGLAFVGLSFAISLTSATLVNALSGIQYVFVFLLIIFFTWKLPRFFKEKITRSELIQEILALLLIAAGLGLIVVK